MNALGVAHCNIVGHNILYRPHDLRYPFVIINFSAAEPLTKIQFGNDQEKYVDFALLRGAILIGFCRYGIVLFICCLK